MPIYAEPVLGVSKGAMLVGLSLMLAFVVAALSFPIHRKIGLKIGVRNAMILNLSLFIVILVPYFLMSGNEHQIFFVITTALVGFPIGGSMFYIDLLHSDVIDEDVPMICGNNDVVDTIFMQNTQSLVKIEQHIIHRLARHALITLPKYSLSW